MQRQSSQRRWTICIIPEIFSITSINVIHLISEALGILMSAFTISSHSVSSDYCLRQMVKNSLKANVGDIVYGLCQFE